MKFSKIYIIFAVVFLCLPIFVAHYAITGSFPLPDSTLFPDAAYIGPLKYSITTALICAVVSTIFGTVCALFLSKLKEKFKVFFSDGVRYEIYIFNTIVFLILWLIIYFNGPIPGFVTLAHCMICTPLVFAMVYGASGDMVLMARCASEIGSSPMQTLCKITLPMVIPSAISGFAASFALSFNDVVVAPFISGGKVQTFTMKLIEYMKNGHDMGTVCTVMLVLALALAIALPSVCIKGKG